MGHHEGLDWVAVGTSGGLVAKSIQRAVVGEHDLAVWRGQDGLARAWENRCPHRGMRLSLGFVRANRLTCLYHGWTYGGEGKCEVIPAHPRLVPPKTITVNRYACVEKFGLIWVASAGRDWVPAANDGTWIGCRSLKVDVPALELALAASCAAFPPRRFRGATAPSEVRRDGQGSHTANWRSGTVSYVSTPILPHAWHVEAKSAAGRDALIMAVQRVTDDISMLHIAIAGEADDDETKDVRRHVSDWAKRFRLTTENDVRDGRLREMRRENFADRRQLAGAQ